MTRPEWHRLAAYGAVVTAGAFGLWRVETTANQAQDTADALEAEVHDRQDQSCRRVLASRDEAEQLLVDIVVDLGGEPMIVEAIHRHYDQLPPPADC